MFHVEHPSLNFPWNPQYGIKPSKQRGPHQTLGRGRLDSVGIVICIVNQKGGVGKTTTAINLAASLAAAERRCLLLDSDPQGNATTGLGVDRKSVQAGLYEVLMGAAGEEAILSTALPFLSLVASTPRLIGAEVEMAPLTDKEYLLRNALTPLRDRFDYILLDCPPSLGYLTVNALTAANVVLVPLQCEYYALEGLSQLIQTIKAVKRRLNPGLGFAGILLTMYDRRNNLSSQVADEVRQHFKGQVFRSVIPRNVRLSEAPSHGKPILLYDIRSRRCPKLSRPGQGDPGGKEGMTKRKALGKGLSALIPEANGVGVGEEQFFQCPVEAIEPNPFQPRTSISDTELEEMVQSVREKGILTPLLVSRTEKGYQLIAGERRWRAALKAGLERVPVVVREASEGEFLELALIENIHRKDLNPIEEASAYKRLLEQSGPPRNPWPTG